MIKLVVNSSPVISLAKIDKLDLLKRYSILVPTQVVEEIMKGKARNFPEIPLIESFLRASNVIQKEAEILSELPPKLGKGEKATISLAYAEKIDYVLIDEGDAREIACAFNLRPRGTLWVLKEAKKRELLTKSEVKRLILELVEKGYRIKKNLRDEFLDSL